MSAPLEPTKILRADAVKARAPRIDGNWVLIALGVLLVVSVFRAHEVSLLLRVPALGAGELVAAVGTVGYRRTKLSQTFSLEAPTGPGTNVCVALLVAGIVLGALCLSVAAPAYMTMLGMIASLTLAIIGWGSMARG